MKNFNIERRQGQLIVRGTEYKLYQCGVCNHIVPRHEKEVCFVCNSGTMNYIGKIVLRPGALPDVILTNDDF